MYSRMPSPVSTVSLFSGIQPPAAALESARKLIQCGVNNQSVRHTYTLYRNCLDPRVPEACDCGPIATDQEWLEISCAATDRPSTVGPLAMSEIYGVVGEIVRIALILCFLITAWVWKRRSRKNTLEKKIRLRFAWALTHYEISPKNLCLVNPLAGPDKVLGKRNFGVVVKDRLVDWKPANHKFRPITQSKLANEHFVAVKLLAKDKRTKRISHGQYRSGDGDANESRTSREHC
ncbi:hypothetical protein RvY_08580 [Ramazzottius varieornatus]|uniref:Uncharacterized protein n=1 Tax=Ramazzottius varieornatus TaxID=947166 RepID=A0A1D1VEE9_RAMVA|nr:hypothetical protein RvY_08580 [Ramazzottius varieornatus]